MKSQAIADTLRGKNVLITGATSGIGESLARQFGAQGANLSKDFYHDKPHDSPEVVAAAIVDAFLRREAFAVTGPQKWLMTHLPRLLSRKRAISMMAGVSRKQYNHR